MTRCPLFSSLSPCMLLLSCLSAGSQWKQGPFLEAFKRSQLRFGAQVIHALGMRLPTRHDHFHRFTTRGQSATTGYLKSATNKPPPSGRGRILQNAWLQLFPIWFPCGWPRILEITLRLQTLIAPAQASWARDSLPGPLGNEHEGNGRPIKMRG